MTSVAALYEQAMELPEGDRSILVELLSETLLEKEPGYDEAWREELDRREAEHEAGRDPDVPWDEAMRRIFETIDPQ